MVPPSSSIQTPREPLAIIDWGFNAWGGKYLPTDLDENVPSRIAELRKLPAFHPGIIM